MPTVWDITLESEWDDYAENVLRKTGILPDTIQYVEMKKAFFSGFYCMLIAISKISSELSENAACRKLTSIQREADEFFEGETLQWAREKGH